MQDHNMAQSVELAKFVQRRTCASAGRQNKGVKQAGFLVLRETSMPSCLIELGFISTPDEERFLNSTEGVSQLGRGIYQAFLDYKRKYDTNVSVSYKEEPQQPEVKPEVKQEVKPEVKQEIKLEKKKESKKESKKEVKQEVKKDTVAVQPAPAPAPVEKVAEPIKKPAEPAELVKPTEPAKKTAEPVFKVQILASGTNLPLTAPQFKGQEGIDSYEEGGMYKFTVGASTNYNEIYQLRKSLLEKFPQAFIIAFKNDQKVDVRQAIEEFKRKKVKK